MPNIKTIRRNGKLYIAGTNNEMTPELASGIKKAGFEILPSTTIKTLVSNPPPATEPQIDTSSTDRLKTEGFSVAGLADLQAKLDAEKAKVQQAQQKELSTLGELPSTKNILTQAQTEAGLPAINTQLTSQGLKVASIQKHLDQLDLEEMRQLQNAEGKFTSMPALNAEKQRIARDFDRQKAYVAVNLGAEAAVYKALAGERAAAHNMVKDIVDAALYDNKQKLEKLNLLVNQEKGWYNSLDRETQNYLKNLRDYNEQELKTKKAEKEKVLRLMVNNPQAGINVNDTYEEAAKKAARITPQIPKESDLAFIYPVLEQAISSGATPEAAAQSAIIYAERLGIPMKKQDAAELLKKAKTIQPIPAPAPQTETQPSFYDKVKEFFGGRKGETPQKETTNVSKKMFGDTSKGTLGFFGSLFGE